MNLDNFIEWLETQPMDDMLVRIRYKYSHETTWTYSNEVLCLNCDGEYEWLNDWDEGQQDVEVIGCIPISKIKVPSWIDE